MQLPVRLCPLVGCGKEREPPVRAEARWNFFQDNIPLPFLTRCSAVLHFFEHVRAVAALPGSELQQGGFG